MDQQRIPDDEYDQFVDHPRYGRGPRITGLDPKPSDPDVHLHWNTKTHKEIKAAYEAVMGPYPYGDINGYRSTRRIPNTAIAADLERQAPATVAVTHYFDLARECRDCKRPFIFFAEEQKHWYEELGFGLDSDCVRCVECRKREQGIARHRETYEALFHVANRDVDQTLEMADACLSLIEARVFSQRKAETVRMLFNSLPKEAEIRERARFADLETRLLAAERVRQAGSSHDG